MIKNNVFDLLSKNWWKKKYLCEPLHIINNIRFNYIKSKINIKDKEILDIGCGGGILTEKLAIHGAIMTGLDNSKKLIKIAKERNINNNLKIKYKHIDDIIFLENYKKKFDVIVCMEILEHIENKKKLINLIKNITKKNSLIIISSLNKNLLTYIKMILFAEFISNKLPKNTHKFNKFTKIEEINSDKKHLKIIDIKEIKYDPILKYSNIKPFPNINYIICLKKY